MVSWFTWIDYVNIIQRLIIHLHVKSLLLGFKAVDAPGTARFFGVPKGPLVMFMAGPQG